MNNDDNSSYYTDIKPKMMKDFEKAGRFARQVLGQFFDGPKIDKLLADGRCEYETFIPKLPYIGGKKNSSTFNLIGGAVMLAIIRPLEKEGLTTREIGKAIYETMVMLFNSRPRIVNRLIGKLMCSKFFIKKKKKQIKDSPFRHYPGGWISEFVKSDGDKFDFGLDIIECGICTFYKEQGAEKYIQYLCLGDYPMFRAFGIGFTRTQTIGNGAPRCDFRFKKAGKTVKCWPLESLEEFKGEYVK